MIADAYGWSLMEIFQLNVYQVYKLIQAINYRASQRHKERIIEIVRGTREARRSLMNYLEGPSKSTDSSEVLADSGFEKQ